MTCLSSEEQRSRGLQQWLASLPVPALGGQSSAELQLTVGALIVEEMRAAVEKHTGYRCSAGISHNKVRTPLIFSSEYTECNTLKSIFAMIIVYYLFFPGIGQTSLWSEQT